MAGGNEAEASRKADSAARAAREEANRLGRAQHTAGSSSLLMNAQRKADEAERHARDVKWP